MQWLSVAELKRRLDAIRKESWHLRTNLPKDSPHNSILRIRDIGRYIGCSANFFAYKPQPWQKNLSRFFWSWDRGDIVKALVNGEWVIVSKRVAQFTSPAPRPGRKKQRVIKMRIDRNTLGLTLE